MDVLPNPWTESDAYDRITVAGVVFVGKIDLDASALLKKKSDHRRARGRNGGRTVNAGWDLVEFPLTLTAHAYDGNGLPSSSFAQLTEILRRVGRGAVATQDQRAVAIAHPYLDAVSISQVTVQEVGFVPVQAGGGLGLKLKLKEFRPPAQAPGARTPSAAQQGAETRPGAKAIPPGGTIQRVDLGEAGADGPPIPTQRPPRSPPPPSSDP